VSLLYLHTAPEPGITGTDAVFNEVQLLRIHFGGFEYNLYPLGKPSAGFPRFLYGWHILARLRRLQQEIMLNHVFAPGLYDFPVLRYLRKPIIYSVTASVRPDIHLKKADKLKTLAGIIVNNDRDYQLLRHHNFNNVYLVRPGIDTSMVSKNVLPLEDELILLMASAPWERSQFTTKGVDLLLDVARQLPFLKLIFLWRGLSYAALMQQIRQYGVEKQVTVYNEKVFIGDILQQVHGTILLAENAMLVKAFPHSLVESLAAAKPVIVSSAIAMADYVEANACGVVVKPYSPEALIGQIDHFRSKYAEFCDQADQLGASDFSPGKMLAGVAAIYHPFMANQ
jgi:glycosyltransferase involved in cell wall biosynthesis